MFARDFKFRFYTVLVTSARLDLGLDSNVDPSVHFPALDGASPWDLFVHPTFVRLRSKNTGFLCHLFFILQNIE